MKTTLNSDMAQINPLRPITQRLTSTPVQELPHIAYFLAASIGSCSHVLQTTSSQSSTKGTDNTVLVHKLKTRVSSLLQERSQQGRLTAVILIKAIVEAGGREILSSSEAWVRGLIAILGKHDSTSTKKLSLITITRIFILTQQYPTLVREITTPLLPSFITTCLNLIKPTAIRNERGSSNILSPFLETVLKCLLELIPHHPTIFRPFVSRLQPIALALIGASSTPLTIADAASDILTVLHFSASKNSAAAEWSQAFEAIISSCHGTVDQIFRGFIEDWEPSRLIERRLVVNRNYDSHVQGGEADPYGLPRWAGIHSGAQRVVRDLRLLKSFVSNHTALVVSCNLGLVVDLTSRLNSVAAVMDAKALQFSARLNGEVGRDEKEEIWMELPVIHIAALELLSAVIISFSRAAISIARPAFAQVVTIFNAEHRVEGIRVATYRVTHQLLTLLGSSMAKSDFKELTTIVKGCCSDLTQQDNAISLQTGTTSTGTNQSRPNGFTQADADAFIHPQKDSLHERSPKEYHAAYHAAFRLLPCFMTTLPSNVVPHSLRTEIDRTAILAQHQRAMLASVLNPPPVNGGRHAVPSIMPFLARTGNGELDVEALLRPRMPVVRNDKSVPDDADDMSGDETENEDMESQSVQDVPETDLLDRLEHSLDDSPLETRDSASALYSEVTGEADALAAQSSLELSNIMKRDYASLDDDKLTGDQSNGANTIKDSHVMGTDVNKKRRLECDTETIENDNPVGMMNSDGSTLQQPNLHVVVESLTLSASTPQQPENGTASAQARVATNTSNIGDEDDSDSDFEMPPINIEMTSSEEEEDE